MFSETGWLRNENFVRGCLLEGHLLGTRPLRRLSLVRPLEALGQPGQCQWCGSGEGGDRTQVSASAWEKRPPSPPPCPVPWDKSCRSAGSPPHLLPPPSDRGPKPEAWPGTRRKAGERGRKGWGQTSPCPTALSTPSLACTGQSCLSLLTGLGLRALEPELRAGLPVSVWPLWVRSPHL